MPPAGTAPLAASSGNPEFLGLDFLNTASCFETLRVYRGRIFYLNEHIARFAESCRGMGNSFPSSSQELAEWLTSAVRESGYPQAIARVSLHWPAGSISEGEIVVLIRPFDGYPASWYTEGVSFQSSALRRSSPRALDPQLKVSQYVAGVLATLDRGEVDSHEILFFGDTGLVAEGSVSNLFIVRKGVLLTPSAASGILRGVTRSVVMGLAGQRGYLVRETGLTRHDLYSADECWMTNTSSEVLPVTTVDNRKIQDGVPGPVAKQLLIDFQLEVERYLHENP